MNDFERVEASLIPLEEEGEDERVRAKSLGRLESRVLKIHTAYEQVRPRDFISPKATAKT